MESPCAALAGIIPWADEVLGHSVDEPLDEKGHLCAPGNALHPKSPGALCHPCAGQEIIQRLPNRNSWVQAWSLKPNPLVTHRWRRDSVCMGFLHPTSVTRWKITGETPLTSMPCYLLSTPTNTVSSRDTEFPCCWLPLSPFPHLHSHLQHPAPAGGSGGRAGTGSSWLLPLAALHRAAEGTPRQWGHAGPQVGQEPGLCGSSHCRGAASSHCR